MTFLEYSTLFEDILHTDKPQPPYNNPQYLDYVKLNWSRMNRWFKTSKLTDEMMALIRQIDQPQHWIVITEPWCGDASHSIPFFEMMARENPLITLSYELRDTAPFRIEQYLTNGTRSIPKLIIRDAQSNDLATWGPRPNDCQTMYLALKAEKASFDSVKVQLQNWYNANKGLDIQKELIGLLIPGIIPR